jgi:hypothetical protein
MPIGTVDYTSTAPWNDPVNPWPRFAQVTLSASDIPLTVIPLKTFKPNAAGGGSDPFVIYQNGSAEPTLALLSTTLWAVTYTGSVVYGLTTSTRDIPQKAVGTNGGWEKVGGGSVSSLYIAADTSVITPWEYRRRRSLELC